VPLLPISYLKWFVSFTDPTLPQIDTLGLSPDETKIIVSFGVTHAFAVINVADGTISYIFAF
jgi:hypothetical protein